MPAPDPWKRYFDAGLEFTEVTRKHAEKLVKDLVKSGEVQREHAQQRVEDLVERSRKASASLAEAVRTEVTRQLAELGLVSPPKKPGVPEVLEQTAAPAKAAATKTTAKVASASKKAAAPAKKAAKKVTKKAASATKKATGQS